jgi:hypothetical protein
MNLTLFVGDIHGHPGWKQPVGNALSRGADIVFLGDYVDSFTIDSWIIFENFKDIIEYKKKYPKRITLLYGNHDWAYAFGNIDISGFNFDMWSEYKQLFNDNSNLFDLAWGFQGKNKYTLVTHAGLTRWFYEVLESSINDPTCVMHERLVNKHWKELPLHELINHFKDQGKIMWKVGPDRGGVHKTGSILWADRNELVGMRSNNYPGINQIIGHTPGEYIEIRIQKDDELYFIDTFAYNFEKTEYISSLMLELD